MLNNVMELSQYNAEIRYFEQLIGLATSEYRQNTDSPNN
jgi:hypothetical protein